LADGVTFTVNGDAAAAAGAALSPASPTVAMPTTVAAAANLLPR
jgi:hypothetical protein